MEWRKIDNFPNYEVSNTGLFRNIKKGKEVKQMLNKRFNRYQIKLYNKNKDAKFFSHILIAKAFIPNINNYKNITHIDYDETNNHISNLKWVDNNNKTWKTKKDSIIHKKETFNIVCDMDLLKMSNKNLKSFLKKVI